ncbi:MAG: T9SS type A sorting domain-containing protein [Crocinitomicaceae bacterium]|nr:T9SS type A sorting domain-containing protein [Crocinitomicaceae bacterium]
MKNFYFLVGALLTSFSTLSQNVVEVNASDNWVGYMNVFELGGNYVFGTGWGVPDLKTTADLTGNQVILQPNFNTYENAVNSGDPGEIAFWTDGADGGNKIMEANTLVEPGAGFNEQDLTFSGSVVSNTLDAGYEASFFIKALDPAAGYSDALGGSKIFPIPASGNFSVSVTAAEVPAGLIIQYGFTVVGINANPTEEANLGSIVMSAPACNIDVTSSSNGLTIEANAAGLAYQWVNCDDNFSVIAGATNQSYTATANGNYAVVITDGNCSDTSDCVAISTVGLEAEDFSFNIYPNPVTDNLYINVNGSYETFKIFNATGQSVKSGDAVSTINLQAIPRGIYFLQLNTSDAVLTRKFIKK